MRELFQSSYHACFTSAKRAIRCLFPRPPPLIPLLLGSFNDVYVCKSRGSFHSSFSFPPLSKRSLTPLLMPYALSLFSISAIICSSLKWLGFDSSNLGRQLLLKPKISFE